MLTTIVNTPGMVKICYFSQLIIRGWFFSSLSPLESGFISAIPDASLHDTMMLASNNADRGVFKPLPNSLNGVFRKNS